VKPRDRTSTAGVGGDDPCHTHPLCAGASTPVLGHKLVLWGIPFFNRLRWQVGNTVKHDDRTLIMAALIFLPCGFYLLSSSFIFFLA